MIYNVEHSFTANQSGAGTIDIAGTITTDGTLGAIGNANITDWNLVFSNPGGTQPNFVMTSGNSQVDISGGASLNATATTLAFSIPVPGAFGFPQIVFLDEVAGPDVSWRYLGFNFGAPYFETSILLDTDGSGSLIAADHLTTVNSPSGPLTGDLVGTAINGAGPTVPEPSSILLLGMSGLGLAAYARRQRGKVA